MAAQIDGSWCDVDVHEVIHYTTLNVILDAVDEVPGAHVKDPNEGEVSMKQMERQSRGSKEVESIIVGTDAHNILIHLKHQQQCTCPFPRPGGHRTFYNNQYASESPPVLPLCRSFHNLGCSVLLAVKKQGNNNNKGSLILKIFLIV